MNFVDKYPTAPPEHSQLRIVMKQSGVVENWQELGLQLLQENHVHYLDVIKANHSQNIRDCCREMFKRWLRTRLNASWQQLYNALDAIDLPVAARDIEQELFRGEYVFELNVCMWLYSQLATLVTQ